jgi:hypothetical protein
MPQWEYLVLTFTTKGWELAPDSRGGQSSVVSPDFDDLRAILNGMGRQGWELTSLTGTNEVDSRPLAVLKRAART